MFILDSGCGWIPDPPIKFVYHIINLIKNLTPAVLIIMGSLDFGKAVISHKEDEMKKAQVAFIKKLIAGAAVFFVVVFAQWIIKLLSNAGVSDGNKAFKCVSLLLTGGYSQDDKTYYDGPEETPSENSNTTQPTSTMQTCESCIVQNQEEIQACIDLYKDGTYGGAQGAHTAAYEACDNQYDIIEDKYGQYEECIEKNTSNTLACSQYVTELETVSQSLSKEFGLSYNLNIPCSISNSNIGCYSYEQHQKACYTYANQKENDYRNDDEQNKKICEHDVCQQCNY